MAFGSIIWNLDDHPNGNKEAIMKRIIRTKRLTAEDAAKYQTVREQVGGELLQLAGGHHERMAALDQAGQLLEQSKAARGEKGLSLADLTGLTGMVARLFRNSKRAGGRTRPLKPWCSMPRLSVSTLSFRWPMREVGWGGGSRSFCRIRKTPTEEP